MIGRARHLDDNRLFESYFATRQGEPIDPPTAEHLADCAACATRYAELSQVMDAVRIEGDAEADAVFTADRLRAQQHQIARRLQLVARPARVISFPVPVARRTIAATGSRTAPKWIAGAAAAGLFLGIALGASYEWEWHARSGPSFASRGSLAARALRLAPASVRGKVAIDTAGDDVFLSELELALERPRTRELAAFEAFTPHVREIRDVR